MPKILIFGAAGSGCTTLGKKLADKLGIRFIDSDDYYWLPSDPPYTVPRPVEEKQSKLKADITQLSDWIVAGSLHNWGGFIVEYLTHAVFLYVPHDERMKRLKLREQKRFGARIEPQGDMAAKHMAFMEWASSYDDNDAQTSRTRKKHLDWATTLPCPVIKIEGCDSMAANLRKILSMVNDDDTK